MNKTLKIISLTIVFIVGILFLPTINLIKKNFIKAEAQSVSYIYPKIENCDYRWNLLQRIYKDTGVWPLDAPNMQIDGVLKTVIFFAAPLNATQLAALDAIMASPTPCSPPPATGTKYQFVDIYENKTLLGQKFGITNFWIWYANGGSTVYIYFDNTLTQGEKNKVKSEFSNLFVEF